MILESDSRYSER